MTKVMIPLEMDVLDRLWMTRKGDQETWSQIVSRMLTPAPMLPLSKACVLNSTGRCEVEVLGQRRTFHSAIDGLVWLLDTLSDLDAEFPERLVRAIWTGTRNHLGRTKLNVYPLRPDLAENSRQLKCGWFLGSNISNKEKRRIAKAACRVLHLEYGADVKFLP